MVKIKDTLRDKVFWVLLVGLFVVFSAVNLLATTTSFSHSQVEVLTLYERFRCGYQPPTPEALCEPTLVLSGLFTVFFLLGSKVIVLGYALLRQWSDQAVIFAGCVTHFFWVVAIELLIRLLQISVVSYGDWLGYVVFGGAATVLLLPVVLLIRKIFSLLIFALRVEKSE